MAAPQSAKKSILSLIVLVVIVTLKFCTDKTKENPSAPAELSPTSVPEKSTTSSSPSPGKQPPAKPSVTQKNGWTIYQHCQLVSHNNNDGDSFRVKLPDGSVKEFRLYFVDTPESTFKRYRDGNTNAERISDQARYFGGITPEASTALGMTAKKFTLALLEKTPFTVATRNEEVYDSGRFYCHVSIPYEGKTRWLDEILVSKGYVRIITQPADLPDGTKAETHRNLLRRMESDAKRNRIGGWQ
jgi:endonuclease YncB( thermonuclease family)